MPVSRRSGCRRPNFSPASGRTSSVTARSSRRRTSRPSSALRTKAPKPALSAIRGPALTFTGDPFQQGLEHTLVYESDAIVAMADGKVAHFGPAKRVRGILPRGTKVEDYGRCPLILAGFVDCHV